MGPGFPMPWASDLIIRLLCQKVRESSTSTGCKVQGDPFLPQIRDRIPSHAYVPKTALTHLVRATFGT